MHTAAQVAEQAFGRTEEVSAYLSQVALNRYLQIGQGWRHQVDTGTWSDTFGMVRLWGLLKADLLMSGDVRSSAGSEMQATVLHFLGEAQQALAEVHQEILPLDLARGLSQREPLSVPEMLPVLAAVAGRPMSAQTPPTRRSPLRRSPSPHRRR